MPEPLQVDFAIGPAAREESSVVLNKNNSTLDITSHISELHIDAAVDQLTTMTLVLHNIKINGNPTLIVRPKKKARRRNG